MKSQEQKQIEDYIDYDVTLALHNLGFEPDPESFKGIQNAWSYILSLPNDLFAKIYFEEDAGYLDTIFWVMGFITHSRTGYTATDIDFFKSQQCDSFNKFKKTFNELINYLQTDD